ncbi:MAG TPA: hypothetical protein VFJ18_02385 [Pararhizobium sp.]|nr:hypothetical protein [Pararhizobium sp.]
MAKLDERDEKPLDPAFENVRRKMIRLLAISIGIMCIGLIAVAAAIVYKVSTTSEPKTPAATSDKAVPAGAPAEATAKLPAGFTVSDVRLDGNRILFYGKAADGVPHALVFDIGAGRIVADIAVTR